VAPRFHSCKRLYDRGRRYNEEARECFADLREEFPDSYAAKLSCYWIAKCFYRTQGYEEAADYFQCFLASGRYFGLLDDVRYYQLIIRYRQDGPSAGTISSARQYLQLFPDSGHCKDVQKMLRNLLSQAGEKKVSGN